MKDNVIKLETKMKEMKESEELWKMLLKKH